MNENDRTKFLIIHLDKLRRESDGKCYKTRNDPISLLLFRRRLALVCNDVRLQRSEIPKKCFIFSFFAVSCVRDNSSLSMCEKTNTRYQVRVYLMCLSLFSAEEDGGDEEVCTSKRSDRMNWIYVWQSRNVRQFHFADALMTCMRTMEIDVRHTRIALSCSP